MTDSNKESEHATKLSKELNLILEEFKVIPVVDDLLSALLNEYPKEVREWFKSHSPKFEYHLWSLGGEDKFLWCAHGGRVVVKLIQVDGYAVLSCPPIAAVSSIESKVANYLIRIFKEIERPYMNPRDLILMYIKNSSDGLSFEEISRLCEDEGYIDTEIRLAFDALLTEARIYVTTGKRYKVVQ